MDKKWCYVCLSPKGHLNFVFETIEAMQDYADNVYSLRGHTPTWNEDWVYEFVDTSGAVVAMCYCRELKS